jgi:elongation factor P
MAIANELKIGNIVAVRGGRFKVVKTEHVKPGKGGAFIQAELKNIQTGSKLNERFRSDENVDIIFVETRKGSFMYDDGSSVVIMLSETFEQFEIPCEIFGDSRYFLNDTMEITLELIGEEVVNARIPLKIEVEIDLTMA